MSVKDSTDEFTRVAARAFIDDSVSDIQKRPSHALLLRVREPHHILEESVPTLGVGPDICEKSREHLIRAPLQKLWCRKLLRFFFYATPNRLRRVRRVISAAFRKY